MSPERAHGEGLKDCNPFFSIVIPVYNMADVMRRSVDSVLAQDFENFEIVLVNDGSSDDSAEVCDLLAADNLSIRVIHKVNGGLSSARNAGVRDAKGEYVGFLDADDWIEANTLSVFYEAILEDSPSCVRGNYFVDLDGAQLPHELTIEDGLRTSSNDIYELAFEFVLGREPSYVPLFFIRQDLVKRLPFDETVPFLEDSLYAPQLIRKSDRVRILNFPFYHYYVNSSGMSKNPENFIRNSVSIVRVGELVAQEMSRFEVFVPGDDEKVRSYRSDLFGRRLVSAVSLDVLDRDGFVSLSRLLFRDPNFCRLVDARHPSVFRWTTYPILVLIRGGRPGLAWSAARSISLGDRFRKMMRRGSRRVRHGLHP